MVQKKRFGFFLSLGFLFAITLLLHINYKSEAAEVDDIVLPSDYSFVYNGKTRAPGSEIELTTKESIIYVTSDKRGAPAEVEWMVTEPGVLELEDLSYGSNYKKLVRVGPGYSMLTAIIKHGSDTFPISCVIKVGLEFDYQKTGMTTITTTNERVLILDKVNDTRDVYLKYVDYIDDDSQTVTGGAIIAAPVTWESDNEGVVTVDQNGKVTAVGGGSATITVKTDTLSVQDKPIQISLKAVVSPSFELEYDDINGEHHKEKSVDNVNLVKPAKNVPSNFVIESNATSAVNLTWEVYDSSTGKKLPTSGPKLSYTVSSISGNVSFKNVKAGTYEIYAFANSKFNVNTKVPYAYMKIIVPIVIGDQNVIMNVGDTYDLLENSNVPGNIFEYFYAVGNDSIVSVDQTKGIVTANGSGVVKLRLVYKDSEKLYDEAAEKVNDIYINITVIDGIKLNYTSAKIYTSGTILLQAIVTEANETVNWESSEPNIASVEKGLVKGLKPGTAIITAWQKINGVIKKATCTITVQQSVASIELTPKELPPMAIGSYATIKATVKPDSLSGVKLHWRSSNTDVVSVEETTDLSATILARGAGTAVIAAINQDNVVVGYCHVVVRQTVTSIALSETMATVDLSSKRLQLRATVYPENATNQKISWTSTDPSVAKVDQNGLVTLLKPGTVAIIATSDDNPKVTAMCRLTINIPVLSIALDETQKTMYVGQSARLSYLLMPANASNASVTWTSTNPSVVSVDATGKVTAKGVGTAVIILKTVDGGLTTYCTISVRRVASGVSITPSELKLKTGEKYTLEAVLTPKDSTDTDLVWESSDTKIATVDDKGVVVAKDAGKAVIMVRTEAGATAFCNVTVTKPVEGVILNFTEKTIYVGQKFELKASVNPSDATNLGVTWKSSNPKVATVNKDGVVEGLTGGTTLISVTTAENGFTAICAVTVRELVSTIKIDPDNYKLGKDKSVILTATVTNQTATNHNVKWKSSNEKVATVTQKGKVTGISYGFATITAIAQDGSEVEAYCEIEVVRSVTRISLNESYLAMLVGEGKELKATIEPKNATYKKVTWTSDNTKVAIVDEDGYVTAIAPGNAMITASAQDNSQKKAVCYITVSERVQAQGITLQDKKLTMAVGDSTTVRAALKPVNSTDKYTWSSDNLSVAKVDKKTGKITAISAGTATITVMTDSGIKASLDVNVIGLNVTELKLEQYDRYRLEVEGATSQVKWSTSDPSVVTVTNGNLITYATGTADVYATVNGKKLRCRVTVVKIK